MSVIHRALLGIISRVKVQQQKQIYKRTSHRGVTTMSTTSLETLKFDNLALRRLPIDSEERNYVRTVSDACFSRVRPTPVESPSTVVYSLRAMSDLLDLPVDQLERADFAEYFSGNKLLPGSEPAAHCYCGHQFGFFTGQLGDGAAMYLGEIINSKNERWEIQLKGAGRTPYSRTADGRKVMRSSIREFLCSEAMHFLGIPTTRAGSCVTSDSTVIRDIFYDGHPIQEKCTIVSRIAPTFLRFGSFEIFKTIDPITRRCGPSVGKTDMLKNMLDYTIENFFPEVHHEFEKNNQEKYAKFFEEVVRKTAWLVAQWQSVGFCHGVLNTDNMSIVGLTIDYGPFGFMDMFNRDYICNTSDDGGRYTYIKQPEICLWNLKKLAEAIESVLPLSVSSQSFEIFEKEFNACYMEKMRQKLGLFKELPEDVSLVEALFDTMEQTGADFTNTFLCMGSLLLPGMNGHEASLKNVLHNLVENCCYPKDIVLKNTKMSMSSSGLQMLLALSRTNPEITEQFASITALERMKNKLEWTEKLSEMSASEKKADDYELWGKWLRTYCDRLAQEYNNNEEQSIEHCNGRRNDVMNKSNPRFIVRNYILQNAIEKAEAGDYSAVKNVLKQIENPFYDDDDAAVDYGIAGLSVSSEKQEETRNGVQCNNQTGSLPPDWAFNIQVS